MNCPTNSEITARLTEAIYAASEGDVRTVVASFHLAVNEAYRLGYDNGTDDESANWERDIDIIDQALNETIPDDYFPAPDEASAD